MTTMKQRVREFGRLRYDWLLMLCLCSLVGFVIENVWTYFTEGYLDNRHVYLPFLLGYGIIIWLLYVLFGTPTTKTLPLYFIKTFIVFTGVTIGIGYLIENLCGFKPWDFSPLPLSFTPYASVLTSILYSLLISLFMNAHLESMLELFEKWTKHVIVKVFLVFLFLAIISDTISGLTLRTLSPDANVLWHVDRSAYAWVSEKSMVVIVGMFFVYCFIGWGIESLYISWMNKKWTNRGLLFSPMCPIYGFGEFIGYNLLLLLPHNYILYFVIGTAFCTLLELAVAKYMIWKTGYLWWDYTNRPFNYKGILCLESTVAWGVYAVVEMGFSHDGIQWLLSMVPHLILALIVTALIFYMIGDAVYSIRKVRSEGMTEEENNILKVK